MSYQLDLSLENSLNSRIGFISSSFFYAFFIQLFLHGSGFHDNEAVILLTIGLIFLIFLLKPGTISGVLITELSGYYICIPLLSSFAILNFKVTILETL